MTKRGFLKKGLFMAAILTAVLSLAGCPKEAENNGGGSGFSIASIEGTWICSPYTSTGCDQSFVITSNSVTVTLYDTSDGYNSVRFSGEIVKTLKNDSIVGIIGKNSSNEFKVYYLRNINTNTSVEVGLPDGDEDTEDSLEEAEEEFNYITNTPLFRNQIEYHTYLYQ